MCVPPLHSPHSPCPHAQRNHYQIQSRAPHAERWLQQQRQQPLDCVYDADDHRGRDGHRAHPIPKRTPISAQRPRVSPARLPATLVRQTSPCLRPGSAPCSVRFIFAVERSQRRSASKAGIRDGHRIAHATPARCYWNPERPSSRWSCLHPAALHLTAGGAESIPPSRPARPSPCLPFPFCPSQPIICHSFRGSRLARGPLGGGGRLFVAAVVDAPSAC